MKQAIDTPGTLTTDAALAEHLNEIRRHDELQQTLEAAGVPALKRLVAHAQADTGQSSVCARFILGCYNGSRFKFDLPDFRLLDPTLFRDCLAVLRMDAAPRKEVHRYFENGDRLFAGIAQLHGLYEGAAEAANLV